VAQSAYPTITLSSIGANLNTRGPRFQLFSGTCGSLTSLACTTNPLNVTTALGGAGLTIGDTYYIRITTNTNFASPTSGTFSFYICVTDPALPRIYTKVISTLLTALSVVPIIQVMYWK
jgi:hypothetical protein